jgi:DNA-binding transcriptional MerR regulator
MQSLWTGPQVAGIVGIPYDTLDNWVKSNLVKPTYPAPARHKRAYFSFNNIVTIAVLKALRDQGISVRKLKRARDILSQRIGISLEQGLRGGVVVADRRDLLAVIYTLDDAVQIMSLLKGGQLVLPLDDIVAKIQERTERMFGQLYIQAPTEIRVLHDH